MNKLTKLLRNSQGFTLIELLLVIVIIGILSGALIAVINPAQAQRKASEAVLRGNVDKICLAMGACAASSTTPGTTCQPITAVALGVNTPTAPVGGSYSVSYTNPTLTASGTLNTCTFSCTYNTTTGASTATTPNAGCVIN